MRNVLFVLVFLVSFFAKAQDLAQLRKDFVVAADSKGNSERFSKVTSSIGQHAPGVLQAYKAAADIIESKYLPTIEEKKKRAKRGITKLEALIEEDPNNLEVRLVRMSIQENVPKILKYRANLREDKVFLEKHVGQQHGALKTYIQDFMKISSTFKGKI